MRDRSAVGDDVCLSSSSSFSRLNASSSSDASTDTLTFTLIFLLVLRSQGGARRTTSIQQSLQGFGRNAVRCRCHVQGRRSFNVGLPVGPETVSLYRQGLHDGSERVDAFRRLTRRVQNGVPRGSVSPRSRLLAGACVSHAALEDARPSGPVSYAPPCTRARRRDNEGRLLRRSSIYSWIVAATSKLRPTLFSRVLFVRINPTYISPPKTNRLMVYLKACSLPLQCYQPCIFPV